MELLGRRFGHIRITDVAGQGGMGEVYVGYDDKLERKVALKALHANHRLDSEARERLLREARSLSKVDHPHICRIHDYIESSDVDLLVLEYIDGRTLQDAVEEGRLSRTEKLRIALAIADVLVAAHRVGIIHRDLKPENVMLTKKGDVKVLDFGLARWLHVKSSSAQRLRAVGAVKEAAFADDANNVWFPVDDSSTIALRRKHFRHTEAGVTMGTPLYMSPEQARGEELTVASDMYAYGLVLQFLFTAADPHPSGFTAREVILRASRGEKAPADGVPGDIAALIARLSQYAPADRPTAIEATARLRFLMERPRRLARRAAIGLAALIVILASWRYASDLARERTAAVAARAEAESRRGQAEELIEFMLGDLREKLVPVGRLDILDDVGERALRYVGSLKPETLSAEELARNSKALNQLGEVRIAQGKLDEALRIFERSLSLSEIGAKRESTSAPAQLALATSHFWIGDVYRQQGKLPESLQHYTSYMTLAERLAKENPTKDEYQLERAYGHSSVASIYERQADFSRALEHLRLTREIKGARLAAKPEDPERQADLAKTLNRIGLVRMRSGDFRGAREDYESEFAIYSRLVAADARNNTWKDRLVNSHSYLARLLEMMGDAPDALNHRRDALALSRQLAARDADNMQWQRDLAITEMQYGNALRLNGRAPESLGELAAAEEILAALLRRDETVWSWRRDLAVNRVMTARANLAARDVSAAERNVRSAIELLEPLTAKDATINRYLADALLVLGDARNALRDARGARESWSRADATLHSAPLSAGNPESIEIAARILTRLGRDAEAAPLLQQLQRIGYQPTEVHATERRE